MPRPARVLIAGESWVTHSVHQKGFDHFTTVSYNEGVAWLQAALERGGFAIDYLPNHLAPVRFPLSRAALGRYVAVILSDIGSNTLLLHPDTFDRSRPTPNRLALLADYVRRGGGLIMVGGYMSFAGIDGKARYAGTPVEEVLPVGIGTADDRVEVPEGIRPRVLAGRHPVLAGVPSRWPALLGYNRVSVRSDAQELARVGRDPLLVVAERGRGRSLAFTSDCSPHWGPPEFTGWGAYARFWRQAVRWVAGRS